MYQLTCNAVHIRAGRLIKAHGLPIQHADNAAPIQKTDALQKCSAEYLLLDIGFFIKNLADNRRKVKAELHQSSGNLHRPASGIGIHEHTGVRHHADVEISCNSLIQIFFLHGVVHQLAGAARRRNNIIHVPGAAVCSVMIDVDFLSRLHEQIQSISEALLLTVKAEKRIIVVKIRHIVVPDFLRSRDIFRQRIGEILKENIDAHARHGLLKIQGHSQAGARTVSVRADMSADSYGLAASYFLKNIHHSSSSPVMSSYALTSLISMPFSRRSLSASSSIALTSSIRCAISTP